MPGADDPPPPGHVAAISDAASRERRHWQANLRVTGGLLVVWFCATFGVAFFARDLGARFAGWPFSFWVAAQGAPLLYGLLVLVHARALDRFDRQHGLAEADD